MKQRLDQILLKKNLVTSRTQAADLISEGYVQVDGEIIKKPSFKVHLDVNIEIKKEVVFVGRGAHKMEGAYQSFGLSFKDKIVGDMGASTGGFTEYALYKEARMVYAVDVGVGQLAEKLRDNEKVINFEGLNIREGLPFDDCEIIVADLSFISLKLVTLAISKALLDKGEFVFLVKPQFEVGREGLGKNGVVKDENLIINSVIEVVDHCNKAGMTTLSCCPCTIRGKMGNQEFFIYGVKNSKIERINNFLIEEIVRSAL